MRLKVCFILWFQCFDNCGDTPLSRLQLAYNSLKWQYPKMSSLLQMTMMGSPALSLHSSWKFLKMQPKSSHILFILVYVANLVTTVYFPDNDKMLIWDLKADHVPPLPHIFWWIFFQLRMLIWIVYFVLASATHILKLDCLFLLKHKLQGEKFCLCSLLLSPVLKIVPEKLNNCY